MPGPAEMRMAESDDGAVPVLVPGAVFIGARLVLPQDVMGNDIRVGGKLHAPEGNAGAGKGMPHAGRADERIHIGHMLRPETEGQARQGAQEEIPDVHDKHKYTHFWSRFRKGACFFRPKGLNLRPVIQNTGI